MTVHTVNNVTYNTAQRNHVKTETSILLFHIMVCTTGNTDVRNLGFSIGNCNDYRCVGLRFPQDGIPKLLIYRVHTKEWCGFKS